MGNFNTSKLNTSRFGLKFKELWSKYYSDEIKFCRDVYFEVRNALFLRSEWTVYIGFQLFANFIF